MACELGSILIASRDKLGLDFSRLSGTVPDMAYVFGKRLSFLGLAAFAFMMHAGCTPTCPIESVAPYDNRDRKAFPNIDQDWVCIKPREPLPIPELGGDKPVDVPGPKNMEAVAKAAIFLDTCLRNTSYASTNINERIDRLYRTIYARSSQRAIAERIDCFKDKTNGCDAVEECLGIVALPDDPRYAEGCYGHIAMARTDWPPSDIRNVWTNCTGLGLECRDGACVIPREPCDHTTEMPFCTDDGAPRNCEYDGPQDAFYRALFPSCSRFGLECSANTAYAECEGAGPECTPTVFLTEDIINYHNGIECVDSNVLRACVNGREQLVNCASLGEGFKCIGGSKPQCGADFQCDYEGWTLSTSCVDNFVEVCNAGVVMTFDCTALGFDSCYGPLGACVAKPVQAPM